MENFSIKLILNLLKDLLGKGPHQLHEPTLGKEEIRQVSHTIKKNFVSTKGICVLKFEKKLQRYTKAKHATSIINGTQALFIALKALGVKETDEVLVPALTFVGTVNAISYIGAEPHFVDSHIQDFGVDIKKLDKYLNSIAFVKNNRCINKKTGKTIKAIIPVHVFGQPCDIEGIIKISKKFKLLIIEDAAECLGSFYKKKHLGTFGDAGCISFNGNKIITTGGGGAVLTNNKKLENKIKHLVTTAKVSHKWEFIHDEIVYNYRLPSLNAALGLAQISKIRHFLKLKRNLFYKYSKIFQKIEGVKLYTEKKFSKSNYWLQTIILDQKNSHLKNKLIKEGHKKKIYMRPAWKLITELKPYKKKQKMNLSGAQNIYKTVINLPSSQKLIKINKTR
jgi:perosamine synthetase